MYLVLIKVLKHHQLHIFPPQPIHASVFALQYTPPYLIPLQPAQLQYQDDGSLLLRNSDIEQNVPPHS